MAQLDEAIDALNANIAELDGGHQDNRGDVRRPRSCRQDGA